MYTSTYIYMYIYIYIMSLSLSHSLSIHSITNKTCREPWQWHREAILIKFLIPTMGLLLGTRTSWVLEMSCTAKNSLTRPRRLAHATWVLPKCGWEKQQLQDNHKNLQNTEWWNMFFWWKSPRQTSKTRGFVGLTIKHGYTIVNFDGEMVQKQMLTNDFPLQDSIRAQISSVVVWGSSWRCSCNVNMTVATQGNIKSTPADVEKPWKPIFDLCLDFLDLS